MLSVANELPLLLSPHIHSNPFSTRFVQPGALAYRFSVDECENMDECSNAAECRRIVREIFGRERSLIVGPHGTGKSTLLETIGPQVHDAFDDVEPVLLHSPVDVRWRSRWSNAGQNSRTVLLALRRLALKQQAVQRTYCKRGKQLLIVDGMEQLSFLSRHRMLARAASQHVQVLATSHRPIGGFHVLHETCATAALASCLTDLLISDVSSGLRSQIVGELANRNIVSDTSIRDLWFDFYDLTADSLEGERSQ